MGLPAVLFVPYKPFSDGIAGFFDALAEYIEDFWWLLALILFAALGQIVS